MQGHVGSVSHVQPKTAAEEEAEHASHRSVLPQRIPGVQYPSEEDMKFLRGLLGDQEEGDALLAQ